MRIARRMAVSLLATSLLLPLAAQQPAQDTNALRAKAFAAENDGRFGEAADAFVLLSKAEPARADWVVAAGRCLGRSGRFREALELLDAGRKQFPDVIDVPNMLARTLVLRLEREPGLPQPEVTLADAADLVLAVLERAPQDEDARLLLAQIRLMQGDSTAAQREAEDVQKRHPDKPGAHVLLGRLALDRFRGLLQQFEAEQPKGQAEADAIASIDRARQAAKMAFTTAARIDPTRAHPHLMLGQIAWLDRKPLEAQQHVADALVIDPEVAVDHDALVRDKKPAERAAFYAALRDRHLAGKKPQPAKVATLRFHEGRARFDAGDWQAASACFQQALADAPAATNNLYYLFLCRYELGDHDGAEQHAARYAAVSARAFADVLRSLDGDRRGAIAAVLKFLGDRAYQQQRLPASRDLNHVIACLKDDADAWNNHAFLCRETGDFEAAFSSYQHAIEKEPDTAQLWNDAAVVLQYHLKGADNLAKARTMYERALQLADKALADAGLPAALRERAQKAKADAQANLAELAK